MIHEQLHIDVQTCREMFLCIGFSAGPELMNAGCGDFTELPSDGIMEWISITTHQQIAASFFEVILGYLVS